jgi:hypothetical protein
MHYFRVAGKLSANPHGSYPNLMVRTQHRAVQRQTAFPTVNTGSMRDLWVHVGRLWTNGEPFLAIEGHRTRAQIRRSGVPETGPAHRGDLR